MKTLQSMLLSLALAAGAAVAQVPVPDRPAETARPVPSAPQLAAPSYILMDFNSGRILVEHNADERVEPASITKLMTAYVVFSELDQGNITLAAGKSVTISSLNYDAIEFEVQAPEDRRGVLKPHQLADFQLERVEVRRLRGEARLELDHQAPVAGLVGAAGAG